MVMACPLAPGSCVASAQGPDDAKAAGPSHVRIAPEEGAWRLQASGLLH